MERSIESHSEILEMTLRNKELCAKPNDAEKQGAVHKA